MKILHLMMNSAEASGVVTFVRELVQALRTEGVESEILTETDLLPETIDADVVHIHGLWRPVFHRMCMKASEQEVPVVWSTHGMTAPWSMAHKRWKKLIAWWLYQKWDLKRAAVLHATVEQEMEWNESLGFKRHVIAPLGTHLPEEIEDRINKIDRIDGERERVVLFVGRVYPVKGLMNVVRAAAQVKDLPIKFRIVGPDEAGHMAELKKLVVDSGQWLVDRVEFVGPKFGEELASEYDNCDVLILPSFTENFGATVVDAMAHFKPVITSTFTPWKIVQDEKCGWWVSNEVESLVKTFREFANMPREELEAMGKRGRKLVEEKYTWEAVAKTVLEAYKEVVK